MNTTTIKENLLKLKNDLEESIKVYGERYYASHSIKGLDKHNDFINDLTDIDLTIMLLDLPEKDIKDISNKVFDRFDDNNYITIDLKEQIKFNCRTLNSFFHGCWPDIIFKDVDLTNLNYNKDLVK